MSAVRGGGAGTSRIPRRSNTFDSDIAAANLHKEKSIQPPPLYPTLDHKPAPFTSTETSSHLVDIKKKLEKDMRDFNTKLRTQSDLDWKLVPSELKIAGTRKRKAPKLTIDKGKDIDWLKKLEERENIKIKEEMEDPEDDEEGAEKKIKEEVEDEEEEGEEEVDEDEMMDEGTDYIQNYFDNGEDYIDENDDLDDGPVY